MKEHNIRKKAKKVKEYITGIELRKYIAQKVEKYVGKNITVFDGAVGSGQLEQFIGAEKIYACEIQQEACNAFLQNYPNSEVECNSFFNYKNDIVCEAVVMNPPFSLQLKDLTQEEKINICSEFTWKKSGKVDDIFILKSLNHTERFAFHICFLGITYRSAEKMLRKILTPHLHEFNIIENAFEDTNIPVAFLVIDKQKQGGDVYKEIYDCKLKEVLHKETCTSTDIEDIWQRPIIPEPEPEVIDINNLQLEIEEAFERNIKVNETLDELIAIAMDDYPSRKLSEVSDTKKFKLLTDDYTYIRIEEVPDEDNQAVIKYCNGFGYWRVLEPVESKEKALARLKEFEVEQNINIENL